MTDRRAGTLVAGAGHAAGELAFRLRQAGYTAPITLVGDEPHLPYQRPPLSKAFLSGKATENDLMLRSEAAYATADIEFVGKTRIVALDRASRRATLSDGAQHTYDHFVFATGGHARKLTCPGADLEGVHVLRTIADVLAIRSDLRAGRRLVIVGGGYIGLEVAAVAIGLGLSVTILEAAPRVLARVTGPELSTFYEAAHREKGVVIQTSATLTSFSPASDNPNRVGAAHLADGRCFPADLALVGIGLIPNTDIAEAAGLLIANGIVVDEFCYTPDRNVFAIGDCSNHPNHLLGRRVRLESVPNAIEQARIVADAITGNPKPYAAVPWFWSHQYDLKLQAVGLAEGYDRTVQRGDFAARAFTLFYLRKDRIVAADSVNRPADFMAAKRLVGASIAQDPAVLADLSVPLRAHIPVSSEA